MTACTIRALNPTHRTRQWVIVFAIALAVITYMDRVCISQAPGDIQRDLNFSKEEMSLVFAAFTLAYGLFEIPCGWLGDTLCPIAVAQILKQTGNDWIIAFWVTAGVYLVGTVCWIFIDPVTPLDEPLTESAYNRHS